MKWVIVIITLCTLGLAVIGIVVNNINENIRIGLVISPFVWAGLGTLFEDVFSKNHRKAK